VDRTEQLRARLLGFRPGDRLWGWFWPLLFAAVGGVMRFWSLGRPHQLVFDETYYVKQASSLLDHGVEFRAEQGIANKVDVLFTHGTTDVWNTTDGDMVVHPPVGKWAIAVGEWIFGQTSSFGWRFSVALMGTLAILMIGRAARRMFGSTLLGGLAAFLLAFEGHHFVLSRTSILDSIVMFWALAAFCALLVDRDRSREILARKVGELPIGVWPSTWTWLGGRPWRWVAGLMLGLCIGTKWSGLYYLAAFGLMSVWWDLGARRAAGIRHWLRSTLVLDAPYAAAALVLTSVVTYLVSWTGWFASRYGFARDWATTRPAKGLGEWVPDSLRSLWHYHAQMYEFSINLSSYHPYRLNPWGWLVQARPTSFFYEGPKRGDTGCHVEQCSKAISSIGTISVWWLGTVAVFFVAYYWLVRRDWRAGAIAAGLLGGYFPWFLYQQRTIYGFYTVAFEPWVILAVVLVLGVALGTRADSPRRRRIGLYAVGGYCLLTLAMFAFFWPIYTAQVIPLNHWQWRMWFPSWV
jgi:dolichyl-phosphate-mannose--protein O-mannosyl transferase